VVADSFARRGVGGGRAAIQRIGRGQRVPLVRATVAGRPTMLLVDTGAYDHILEGWFARELQDAEAAGRPGAVIDHANRKVAAEKWSAVSLAIEGWTPLPSISPLALGDLNPGPRALGIGGILSPQRLAGDGAVAIDFPAGEMAALDGAEATARLAAHATSLGVATRCGATYVIAATVEGREARLLVDTGSFTTDLKATSPPGRALSGRTSVSRDIYTVGGAVTTRMLGDARVRVGKLDARLDLPMVDDRAHPTPCASDGVLGMDVLAGCVLVIEANQLRIGCG